MKFVPGTMVFNTNELTTRRLRFEPIENAGNITHTIDLRGAMMLVLATSTESKYRTWMLVLVHGVIGWLRLGERRFKEVS